MDYLLTFVFCYVIVFLVYYLVVVKRKKGLESFKKGKQVLFFKDTYKLNLKKLDYKKFATSLSFVNAFIIALTVTIIEIFDNLIIKLLVGFVILIPLILICYGLLGKFYKKKEVK